MFLSPLTGNGKKFLSNNFLHSKKKKKKTIYKKVKLQILFEDVGFLSKVLSLNFIQA